MQFERSFEVGGEYLGGEYTPQFWPDIDVYFRHDQSRGLMLVDKLHEAGARFLKSAVIQRADLCLKEAADVAYAIRGEGVKREPYRKVIERHVIELPRMEEICVHARDRGMGVVLSVYDREGLEFAVAQKAAAIKLASCNLVHKPLIELAAKTGVPLVLDTGKATTLEIMRALAWAGRAGASKLILQYSPPAPPAPPEAHHMRRLLFYRDIFPGPIGLSDHHDNDLMLYGAVALGAHVLEKAIVWEDGRDIDHAHAMKIDDVPFVLSRINELAASMGSKWAEPNVPARPLDRMGMIAARDLSAGEVLGPEHVDYAFPTHGIPVEEAEQALGARLKSSCAKGEPLSWTMLDCA